MTPPSGNMLIRQHWAVRKRTMDTWCYAIWGRVNESHVPVQNVVTLSATIYYKENRKRDLDNAEYGLKKITQDCLVRMGLIPDDTPDHVTWGAVTMDSDKWNPRTEIVLSGDEQGCRA